MNDFQQKYDLFQKALHIEKPWYIVDYQLEEKLEQFHLYLDFQRGAKFDCPHCGQPNNGVYDVVDDDRVWRHQDFWQYQTYLHVRLPRVQCSSCEKIRTIHVQWARPKSGFTWMFESELMKLMKEMPVSAAARHVNEHDTLHYYVQRNMDQIDLSNVSRVAIDETSHRRGHRYVTLFVDVDTKRVIYAVEGKDSSVIASFQQHLEDKGTSVDQIQECCCDMSPAFIKGIEETFPNAHITFDKFHVMKIVNEAMDEVRRQEQKDEPLLKKTRYLWLKNEGSLQKKQKEQLLKLKDSHLQTAKAYRLKTSLQGMWRTSPLFSGLYFDAWYHWTIRSRIQPMVKVAQSLKKHEDGILRWFTTNMTNGLLEVINSLVQASKRKARGYRSTKNFITMIYATANKFDLDVKPH